MRLLEMLEQGRRLRASLKPSSRSGGSGAPPGDTTIPRQELADREAGTPVSGKARPRALKSPLVERREARDLKPMRSLRIREGAVLPQSAARRSTALGFEGKA
jgi:hypothetical protein